MARSPQSCDFARDPPSLTELAPLAEPEQSGEIEERATDGLDELLGLVDEGNLDDAAPNARAGLSKLVEKLASETGLSDWVMAGKQGHLQMALQIKQDLSMQAINIANAHPKVLLMLFS